MRKPRLQRVGPPKKVDRLQKLSTYMEAWEPLWRKNRDERRALNPEGPETTGWERDDSLRPHAFVEELLRCSALTSDPIYIKAAIALWKHGFVNRDATKYLEWKLPEQKALNESILRALDARLAAGWSLRKASARIAALHGLDAETFESAAKKLEQKHRLSRKKQQRENSQD